MHHRALISGWNRIEEIALPFYYFLGKGYIVDVASIKGGKIPIDPNSVSAPSKSPHLIKRFKGDGALMLSNLDPIM